MPTESTIHILGAGGHGRVVADALLLSGLAAARIVLRDDRLDLHGTQALGCVVLTPCCPAGGLSGQVHAAVGPAAVRERLLGASGLSPQDWLTVRHPHATVAASAQLGAGSFVAAQAVVGPLAVLGLACIVNHGAVVDHDCELADYVHMAPLASLGGGVRVGRGVLIGAGARVLPGLSIGDGATVGAGAVVCTHIPAGQTWVGVPARQDMEKNR